MTIISGFVQNNLLCRSPTKQIKYLAEEEFNVRTVAGVRLNGRLYCAIQTKNSASVKMGCRRILSGISGKKGAYELLPGLLG